MKPTSRYFVATALMLVLTWAGAAMAARRVPDKLSQPLGSIPTELAGWTASQSQRLTPLLEEVLAATTYLSRDYAKGSKRLNLFISYYAQQKAGESMHSPKNCLPGGGWEIWRYDSVVLHLDGMQVVANKDFIQKNGERSVVFYWYQSKDRIVASEYLGKLLLIRDSILNGHTGGAIVRVIVPDQPGMEEQGSTFAAALLPYTRRCFR
jgi:EpsI family protein